MRASRIAEALDEIIEARQLGWPYTLYRYIADQTGVHPTTVHRYHSGFLQTAPSEVHACARKLLLHVRQGRALSFERVTWRCRISGKKPPPSRVPAREVRQRLDGIVHALELGERQILFRYLAERIGVHSTTVLRYYQGDLQTAPAALLGEIDLLRERIVAGEVVMFSRSPAGSDVVLRERTRKIIVELLGERGEGDERSFFQQLDRQLGLQPGLTRRIASDPLLRFVRLDVHRTIEEFAHGVEYDPCQTYRAGERIRHHLFGRGCVAAKVHKNKVLVDFEDGRQVLLSEAVPEDPFLGCRSGADWEQTSSGPIW